MPDIIQSLWVEGTLSTMERLAVRSFLAHGHPFHLYTYGGVTNAPEGTVLCDAREILPESAIFRHPPERFGAGSLASFADWFRLALLYQRGGWWVDTDQVCLKPFAFRQPRLVGTGWEPKLRSVPVNGILRFPAGDPLLARCLDAFRQLDLAKVEFADTGPNLLKSVLTPLDIRRLTVSWRTFCPISYRDVRRFVAPPERWVTVDRVKRLLKRRPQVYVGRGSYGVHLWNEMWRYNKLDKDATYHPRSLYERLKARYL